MKIKLIVEVETGWDYSPEKAFQVGQDFIRGGPLVVTATGTQDYSIKSAKVVDIQVLEKRNAQCGCLGPDHGSYCELLDK